MKQIATIALAAATLLVGADVHAQAPGAAPVDPAPPAAHTQGWDGHQSWGVGLRTVSKALRDAEADDDVEPTEFGGGGLQLRYRSSARWEFELAIEGSSAELYDGDLVHHSAGATLAVLYHMRPHRNWDWYLLAGVGGTEERFEQTNKGDTEDLVFSQAHVHLGVGLERRFRSFGIGAELRLIGAGLDPEAGDAPRYMEGAAPVPESSSGGQFNLTGTYYF